VLPRNTCPLIKSAVGFKIERICPYFQSCDLVVGETTCDGKKKAWEILEEYVPMHVMELPQRKGQKDKELWLRELFEFKEKVEALTGNTITETSLADAVTLIDSKRAALQRLYDLRRARPTPISGLDALLVVQISFYDDPARFTEKTNALCDELETLVGEEKGVSANGAPRILVSGCPMIIPNWKVPHLLESNGAVVVCEESCTGTRLLTGPTIVQGSGIEARIGAIAERQLRTNCACFTPNTGRLEDIESLCQQYEVDGVVLNSLEFCQPYLIEAERIKRSLGRDMPILSLETSYGDGDIGQLNTRIQAFLEQIAG
jgi:benzoyl-CoA reductase/2-hydroxyglutaryl-CoA dehydratase subunit BcrC/BadD/HgdB